MASLSSPGGWDQAGGHAFRVLEQGLEDVLRRDALMVEADSHALGRLQHALGAVGEFLEVHETLSCRLLLLS